MRPGVRHLVHAARIVASTVGASTARYCFDGRIAIRLAEGWQLAVSPDDAGRFRVEVWHRGRIRATMWSLAGDDARLAELASAAQAEAIALVA